MKLNIRQRMVLLHKLPIEYPGELFKKIMLTPEEVDEFEFKEVGDFFVWNDAGRDDPVDIEFTHADCVFIEENLAKFNQKGVL